MLKPFEGFLVRELRETARLDKTVGVESPVEPGFGGPA
jgi:hypothetical protein